MEDNDENLDLLPGDLIRVSTNIVYTANNCNVIRQHSIGMFINYIEPDESNKSNFRLNIRRCNILIGNRVIDVLAYNVRKLVEYS